MFIKWTVRQLWHKRAVALLVFLAMTALATLHVYSSNTSTFANRSMQLVKLLGIGNRSVELSGGQIVPA